MCNTFGHLAAFHQGNLAPNGQTPRICSRTYYFERDSLVAHGHSSHNYSRHLRNNNRIKSKKLLKEICTGPSFHNNHIQCTAASLHSDNYSYNDVEWEIKKSFPSSFFNNCWFGTSGKQATKIWKNMNAKLQLWNGSKASWGQYTKYFVRYQPYHFGQQWF